MTNSLVANTVNATIGLIFIVAAVFKFRDHSTFESNLASYGLIPSQLRLLVGWIVPSIELPLGIGVVLGIWPRYLLGAATLLFTTFFIANAWEWLRGNEVDCHCFGARDRTSILVSTWRSGFLALLTLALALTRNGSFPDFADRLAALAIAGSVALAVCLTLMLTHSARRLFGEAAGGR